MVVGNRGGRQAAPFSGLSGRGLIPCAWQIDPAGTRCNRASEVYWLVEVRNTKRNKSKLKLQPSRTKKALCADHAECRKDFASINLRSWTEPVPAEYAGVTI